MFAKLFASLTGGSTANDEIKTALASGALLLDVRSAAEYASDRVKGSKNIPLDQLDRFVKKTKDKRQTIVVHCLSGARSGQAQRILQSAGFEHVLNAGGLSKIRNILAS